MKRRQRLRRETDIFRQQIFITTTAEETVIV